MTWQGYIKDFPAWLVECKEINLPRTIYQMWAKVREVHLLPNPPWKIFLFPCRLRMCTLHIEQTVQMHTVQHIVTDCNDHQWWSFNNIVSPTHRCKGHHANCQPVWHNMENRLYAFKIHFFAVTIQLIINF